MRGKRPPLPGEFATAISAVDESGMVDALAPLVDLKGGRPGTIPVRAFLICAMVNGLANNHKGHIAEIARTMVSLSDHQRQQIGLRDANPMTIYKRADRKFGRIVKALQVLGEERAAAVIGGLLAAATGPQPASTGAVAIDGTALETSARLRSGGDPDYDGAAEYADVPVSTVTKARARGAAILGIGPDGRKVYTADRTA
jgi:hypothetical protein